MRLVGMIALLFLGVGVGQADPLRVAAAADLTQAFGELGKLHEQRTSQPVTITFGASGLLARQIEEGAPFDLFAAANLGFVEETVAKGACRGDSVTKYARGRLAIIVAPGVAAVTDPAQLAGATYKRIAIANPAHAPYGKAATQMIDKLHLTDALKPRLVYGENVQQAMQFAQSGNAEAAIVALALVTDRAHVVVDDKLHDPIDQALVVCGKDAAHVKAARAFVDTLRSPAGRAILERYGFGVHKS
jgi:molybdate transport system substrate-binding protein